MKNLRKHKVRPLTMDKIKGSDTELKNKYSIDIENLKNIIRKMITYMLRVVENRRLKSLNL